MLEQNQQPNNRRIFTKNRSLKERTKSQKISTNDSEDIVKKKTFLKKRTAPSLSDFDIFSNIKNLITKNKNVSMQTLPRKKKTKTSVIIKYDLNELKSNIIDINTKINEEKNISLNIYNSLNEEIIEKNVKIKNLAEEQKELIFKLKLMKNEINNKIDKANVLILKKDEENKKEKNLQKLINVKEKEIKLEFKKTANTKKEYKRIIKIFNNNNFTKEVNLRKELFLLNDKISKLEHDNRKLESIVDQHQYCQKHKNELLNFLNLLTNAYQFEVKKANMIDLTINSDSEPELNNLKLDNINDNSNAAKSLNVNVFHSPKIKRIKNFLNNDNQKILRKNKKSQKNLISKSISNYIMDIFKNINSECAKESGIIKNSNDSYFKAKKNLFKSRENLFLEKILPNNYLIKCKERFDNIENENNILKEKINLNIIQKDKIVNEQKVKIEINQIDIKKSKKQKMKLNIDIYKAKKSIEELKKKINELNKETNKYKNIINIKNKENSNIKHRMQEFKKQTKKGNKKGKKEIKEKEIKEIKEEIMNNIEENETIQKKKNIELKEEKQKNNLNYNAKYKLSS